MTRSQFLLVLKDLYHRMRGQYRSTNERYDNEKTVESFIKELGLSRTAEWLAAEIWIHELEADHNTDSLRYQLKRLATNGAFDFELE